MTKCEKQKTDQWLAAGRDGAGDVGCDGTVHYLDCAGRYTNLHM